MFEVSTARAGVDNPQWHLSLRSEDHEFNPKQVDVSISTGLLGHTTTIVFRRLEDVELLILQATGLHAQMQEHKDQEAERERAGNELGVDADGGPAPGA